MRYVRDSHEYFCDSGKNPGAKVCVCNGLGAFNMECDMQNIESRGEKECRNACLSAKWEDL